MAIPTERNPVETLRQHLDAQRASALALIEKQNSLLSDVLTKSAPAGMLSAAENSSTLYSLQSGAQAAQVKTTPVAKGNVISLFDYNRPVVDTKTGAVSAAKPASTHYRVFEENDATAKQQWGEAVDALLAKYGADDALAINRKQMASTLFLSQDEQGLFYFKSQSGVMFVVCFVGADEHYATGLNELKSYAEDNKLQLNLMAHEVRVDDLKACGFTTTPLGIWQRIQPLSHFTINGQKMRRLRYLVNKYRKRGDCKTIEYTPGTTAGIDENICRIMDQWCELKEQTPPYVIDVKKQVMQGDFSEDHRFFLTYRDDVLDNVIVFSRDNYNNGYLMDLEFYSREMPLGSTEFALTQIIERFNEEKCEVVSLGLTMGTGLFEHENGSADVHTLFEQLRKADYLNGDANAQYKNKYRPTTTAMYLARPKDSGKSKLNDLMLLLGTG